jgi:NADPH-dependent 2,4-dienoyl-CoA reductase/sulfur reductase-like enzyme
VAAALLGSGRVALARSPKFHRPRGPSCFRAACDGCLARVDGEPNVMTCRLPASDGLCIETQNVVGSRKTDLLRVADWFFPRGMNPHELLAGVPGTQRAMQAFARRMAGLGKLPGPVVSARRGASPRRRIDALVVGAGPAGMAAALELLRRRRSVEVIDDDLTWGGGTQSLLGADADAWTALRSAFAAAVSAKSLVVKLQTIAAGVYGDDVLVAGNEGVEVVVARTLVLAPGAHDGALDFGGNDVPGVLSARAAGRLLAHGVCAGKRIVVAVTEGGGPFGEAFARSAPSAVLVRGPPLMARGSTRVTGATFLAGAARSAHPAEGITLSCDALVVDAPRSPAYEVCAQAGATLAREPRGFVVLVGRGGRIRDGVFAAGEVVGTPLAPNAIEKEAALLDA